jgi:hypothetical protein
VILEGFEQLQIFLGGGGQAVCGIHAINIADTVRGCVAAAGLHLSAISYITAIAAAEGDNFA